MRLYEEYLKRHKLDNLPIVHHGFKHSLSFKILEKSAWSKLLHHNLYLSFPTYAILNIQWEHNDHRPGEYQFFISYPVRDGYLGDQIFANYSIAQVKYHEYENFIQNYINDLPKIKVFHNQTELFFVAWEVFVYIYDSWFAKQNGDIKYMLYESLDNENDFDERQGFCREIINKIANQNPTVARVWRQEICAKVDASSSWLADLVEKRCTSNMLL